MKTKYWILILAMAFVVCAASGVCLLSPGETSRYAQIHSHGQPVKTVDLMLDQQFTVTTPEGGSNTITVKDGKIAVTEASCPDHYCMDRGFCGAGAHIVCLPNRLVIRFWGEQAVDAVVE